MMKLIRPGRARSFAVGCSILGFIAGSIAISGCSNSDSTVVQGPKTQNKRISRIEELKGIKPGTVPKKKAQ
jgi:hypothetical protein